MAVDVEMRHISHSAGSHELWGPHEVDAKYEQLRAKAQDELNHAKSCSAKSQQAYARGDGKTAKLLSDEAKDHRARLTEWNQQAASSIFTDNNQPGRVQPDEIDLHGLRVAEAEDALWRRVRADNAAGKDHLHVIVGKGIHSVDHIQHLKPAVEKMCSEMGLHYTAEHNAGRIYIEFRGRPQQMPLPQNLPQADQALLQQQETALLTWCLSLLCCR